MTTIEDMMGETVTAVACFPRAGSSLTCQMLAAGGAPVVGSWPAFEDYAPLIDGWRTYHEVGRGRVVKILDAQVQIGPTPRRVPQRFILLTRDLKQQARSQEKFITTFASAGTIPTSVVEGVSWRDLRESYKRDLPLLRKCCRERGPVLHLTFEHLILEPRRAAAAMAEFLGVPLDLDAMVGCVVKRSTRCFDGLLELQQIRQGGDENG